MLETIEPNTIVIASAQEISYDCEGTKIITALGVGRKHILYVDWEAEKLFYVVIPTDGPAEWLHKRVTTSGEVPMWDGDNFDPMRAAAWVLEVATAEVKVEMG